MQEPGIPKYLTIFNSIVSRIKNNELGPGSKVPSENEIIKAYQVSNTTARKVLQEIENAGLAVKIRGRGTFVKDFMIERSATKILSFTKNMIEQGLKPSTVTIDSQVIDKDWSVSVSGEVYTIPGPVFKLRRLRLANGKPMMHETRFISLSCCPEIWKFDLEGSLYKIYSENYYRHITKIEQDLSAIILDEYSKEKLGIRNKMVGLKVEGVTFCDGDSILEAEESIYRGDKYKFSVQAAP
jgi:GntR family transcriptional regulator, N-acetylglucosamine utilization regulator